ncbi:MAG TPA: ECF RNA polymerase sigma factor SigK [Terrabacter sp.]|nr:ECF RNA polymerase sigma factor SigK [Terrabacter sp.]
MDPMSRISVVPSGDDSSEGPARPVQLEQLLRRAATGDETAFAELYDAVSPRLFGLVRRVVRDPAQSEEVTQEVFLEIWRHSARFDPSKGGAMSWMLTIAHRKAVDRVRAAEAARSRDEGYGASTQEVTHDSTAEAVVERLDAERVHRALGTLTPVQRQALELAYLSGYTHTEVASMLDLPLGTAKTRIRDGLIRLRDTLGVTL